VMARIGILVDKMRKLLTFFLTTILALSLVCFLTFVGIYTLVDPNQLKSPLEKWASQKLERKVMIEGPLAWRLNPHLLIEANSLVVANPSPFMGEFLRVKKANVAVSLWSLVQFKLALDLKLEEVALNLEQTGNTHSNWKDLIPSFYPLPFDKNLRITLNSLKIENGCLRFEDMMNFQKFTLINFQFSADKLFQGALGKATPILLAFNLQDGKEKIMANVDLKADWRLNRNLRQVDIQNITLQATLRDHLPSLLRGEIAVYDFANTIAFNGKIDANQIDLSPYLSFFNQSSLAGLSKIKSLRTEFKYQDPWLDVASLNILFEDSGFLEGHFKIEPEKHINLVRMQGEITGKGLKINRSTTANLNTVVRMKEGILDFSPYEIYLNKGHHAGSFQIDMRDKTPKWSLTHQGYNFDIDDLTSLFGYSTLMTGQAKATLSLSSEGSDFKSIRNHLSGDITVQGVEGKVEGSDLVYLLEHTQATVKGLIDSITEKRPLNVVDTLTQELAEWGEQAKAGTNLLTPFEQLEAHLTFNKGIVSYSHINVVHPLYQLEGQGTLDFVNEVVDCVFKASLKDPSIEASTEMLTALNATPLTIQVKGPLDNPIVRPNLEIYAQTAFKAIQKNHSDKGIDKGLEKLFILP